MTKTLQRKREEYRRKELAGAPPFVMPPQNPYSILLDHTPWQIFLTGTLSGEHTSEKKIRLAWWKFLEALNTKFEGDPRKYRHCCDYFVRLERGELGERWHLHALIHFPNRRSTKRLCFAVKAIWQSVEGNGISRTRQVHTGNDAGTCETLADYLTKLEHNKYEGSKTPDAESFILSPSLLQGVSHGRTQLR